MSARSGFEDRILRVLHIEDNAGDVRLIGVPEVADGQSLGVIGFHTRAPREFVTLDRYHGNYKIKILPCSSD